MAHVWNLMIKKSSIIRYSLIPFYMLSEFTIFSILSKEMGMLPAGVFLSMTFLAVCFSPLVEPRYFIVPAAVFLKNMEVLKISETALYYAVLDGILLLFVSGRLGTKKIW